jgi:hypothetical protein
MSKEPNYHNSYHPLNDGLFAIADAISEHSKSIDNLSDIVKRSFIDDFDQNITDRIEKLAIAFEFLNELINEAGRLLKNKY